VWVNIEACQEHAAGVIHCKGGGLGDFCVEETLETLLDQVVVRLEECLRCLVSAVGALDILLLLMCLRVRRGIHRGLD
jgi:hypothetical protein